MEPAKPLGRRKTSIFDLTLPGTAPGLPTPEQETASGQDAPGTPLRARTSVFDRTLPGVTPPEAKKPGLLELIFGKKAAPEMQQAPTPAVEPEPAPLPSRPRTSVFDRTDPGVAVPEPAPSEPEVAPLCPTELKMDADEWDEEGTSVEWNPRWNAPAAPAPAAAPAPPPARSRKGLILAVVGVAAVVGIAAAVALWPRTPSEAPVPVASVPPALQGYYARAQAGDVVAMRMLGLSYCYGVSGPANVPEGVKWLKRAAKAGNATARTELANMGIAVD